VLGVKVIISSDIGTKAEQVVVKSAALPAKSQRAAPEAAGFQTLTIPLAAKPETASTKTS
jgi:hypothetical protein